MSTLSSPTHLSLDDPVRTLDPFLATHDEGELLRRHGPLVPIAMADDVRAWATTTYEASRTVLESHPHLVKSPAHWGAYQRGEISPGWPLLPFIVGESMLFADGQDHRRLRRMITPAFTSKRVAALASRIEDIARQLLDELDATSPDTAVDIKERYAYPLAMRVICEFFGITEPERREALRGHYATMLSVEATDAQRQNAALDLRDELGHLVTAKRAHPGDDLTSGLVGIQEEDGDRLTEKELLDSLQLILIAGHETVVNAITNTLHALLTHPHQLAVLRRGDHDWSDALEAGLHWNGPLRNLYMRFATEDTEIHGATVRKGEPIVVLLATSHRHDGVVPNPERFDITRTYKGHLGFGAGPHFCIGAPLARLEGSIALRELLTRYPGLRLAVSEDELTPMVSPAVNGLSALPVRLVS
ncbi:cytochrome P450 family protein [Streptomyces olivaceoviridis]